MNKCKQRFEERVECGAVDIFYSGAPRAALRALWAAVHQHWRDFGSFRSALSGAHIISSTRGSKLIRDTTTMAKRKASDEVRAEVEHDFDESSSAQSSSDDDV